MHYTIIPPSSDLQSLVSHYWMGTWDCSQAPVQDLYYAIGSSTTDIVFGFKQDGARVDLLFSRIQGHTASYSQHKVPAYHQLLGVSLPSYAIPMLFGPSAKELSEECLSLNSFLGRRGNQLEAQIAAACSPSERIAVLNQFFSSFLAKSHPVDKLMFQAIQILKKQNGAVQVQDLAQNAFLSEKQFKRRFQDYSGFNPKSYARILRFESALRKHSSSTKLSDLALQCGYFDQAHFIRDFKAFSGFSPKEFWKLGED